MRTAAFMGLRMMSDQAAHLARQGSMIPHLYPERQLSLLPATPKPLGMPCLHLANKLYKLALCSCDRATPLVEKLDQTA